MDQFADVDQQAAAPTIRVPNYPEGLVEASRRFPDGPWMYTGGLENHPEVLKKLAELRPLLGSDHSVVRQVRDPWELDQVLRDEGFELPEMRRLESENSARSMAPPDAEPISTTIRWLRKSAHSSGGIGVGWWNHEPFEAGYVQRYVEGRSCGALYLAHETGVDLLGVTLQLSGPTWSLAPDFLYGGSIGPLALDEERRRTFEKLGEALVRRIPLRGLFGVDVIDDGNRIWPIEVNPRYTASVEVLELAWGVSLVHAHLAAFQGATHHPLQPVQRVNGKGAEPFVGKAIVYAQSAWHAKGARFELLCQWHSARPFRLAADLPHPGVSMPPRSPVATVFAQGPTVEVVQVTLKNAIHEILGPAVCPTRVVP